jgi:leucyl aminopeptidase
MIAYLVSDKKITALKSNALVFFLTEKFNFNDELKSFAKERYPHLQEFMKRFEFTGKKDQVLAAPLVDSGTNYCGVFVGLGKKDGKTIPVEVYRRALGNALRKAIAYKCETVALQLPDPKLFGLTITDLVKETVTIAGMTNYRFTDYLDAEKKKKELFEITLCVEKAQKEKAMEGISQGEIISTAVNKTRHWVDLPPSHLTPEFLANKGKEISKKSGLKCTVFNEKQINEMGMGGLAGVSSGSHQDCQLVIMEYTPKKKNVQTIALVGKGITFDSGGLSLKPASSMETMKEDMSGAAAVIATMEALAQLKPDVRVIGITPISENLPSGTATKPGDILRFYNGKTAEVRNTDAEGRLILADALSYAVKHYKPDAIIDIATLTGACAYALGPFYTGLISQHPELAQKVEEAAKRSGDHVWALPFDDDYKKAVLCDVADLCNIGKPQYRAGAITAGFFLQAFVEDVPWVHLDIAGTAFDVPDRPYYRSGATGVGVRLFIDLLMNWK